MRSKSWSHKLPNFVWFRIHFGIVSGSFWGTFLYYILGSLGWPFSDLVWYVFKLSYRPFLSHFVRNFFGCAYFSNVLTPIKKVQLTQTRSDQQRHAAIAAATPSFYNAPWRHLAVSGGIWWYLVISGGIWQFLEVSGGIWEISGDLAWSGGICRYLEISGGIGRAVFTASVGTFWCCWIRCREQNGIVASTTWSSSKVTTHL